MDVDLHEIHVDGHFRADLLAERREFDMRDVADPVDLGLRQMRRIFALQFK